MSSIVHRWKANRRPAFALRSSGRKRIIISDDRRKALAGRPGFLLLEVMLGIMVFGLFLGAVGLTLLHGQENTSRGGDRVRGMHAAERILEASRSIRDGSFAALTAGTHGVTLDGAGTWQYGGAESTFSGGYITSVTVTSLASNWVRLEGSAKWKHGYTRSGSVVLTTELTDWRSTRAIGDWSAVALDGSYIPGGTVMFNDIAVRGDYAFVTSETSGGGAGLYVIDIGSTASPARVLSSFSLGAAGYALAIRGDILYIATSDSSAEIKAYDISLPTTALPLLASYNLTDSRNVNALAVRGTTLLAGATYHASHPELLSFDISSTGSLALRSSLDHGSDINGIAITGTSALLGTANIGGELKIVGITSTGALYVPAVTDYNLTDGSDVARSVVVSGSAAILGRQRNTGNQEMIFFHANNVGATVNSWRHEGSGSLVGLDTDPAECYAFLAADSSAKALQVVNIRTTALPELTSYDSANGPARGLFYDMVRDRLFVATRLGLLIFRPTSATGTCS